VGYLWPPSEDWGIRKKLVQMLRKLWDQLEHHISTGYRISEAAYSSTVDKLLYGIDQGSCSSPILWALLNQLINCAWRNVRLYQASIGGR
jgi:hypothetical protein